MAIDFRCGQCGQLLRVPEDAAGKPARCPKCQALMTVPANDIATAIDNETTASIPTSAAASSPLQPAAAPPNPFAGDQPAGHFPPPPEVAAANPFAATAGADSQNPYASPAPAAYAYAAYVVPGGPRPGLPWENEPRTVGCWFRTVGVVLSSPMRAFSMMRQYGGLGPPLLFNCYAIGMLFALAAAIGLPLLALLAAFAGKDMMKGETLASIAIVAPMVAFFAVFYAVMLTVVSPLMTAVIFHLALWLIGGARQGFETTFRVICFAQFSVLLPGMFLGVIPYLGGVAVAIWMLALYIIGISRAHETSGGKAAGAVLAPFAICCGGYLALIAVFVAGPSIVEALRGR